MSVENHLVAAMVTRLLADPQIIGVVGPAGVRDRLMPRMELPSIVLAEVETRDYSTATEAGSEHFITLEVWAAGEGRRQAQEIAGLVRQRLHDADLTLAGDRTLVSLLHQTSRSRREPKTRLSIVEMRFRAVTE